MKMQNMKRSETTEQVALFIWAERTSNILPELALMYHVPNEGKRTNGGILKAAGLKSGVPDIVLPVASNEFHGLYIELKFGKNKTTKAQEDYMALLKEQNYKTVVCYGFEEAKETILKYLSEPGHMPKCMCIQAAWINRKCLGISQPSGMFTRKECTNCKHHTLSKTETLLKDFSYHANGGFGKGIVDAIFYLSCGKQFKNYSLEETLESISKNLSLLVKCKDITVELAAAVLSVAIDAYEIGKKEKVNG